MGDEASNRHEVIIGGLGGQGVLTIGQLLAQAGMSVYKHVSYHPSYSYIKRGAPSECAVILSDDEISFTALAQAQTVMVLAPSELKAFAQRVKPGGTLIAEKERLKDKVERDDIRILEIPAAETARRIGDVLIANLVFLGAYIEATKALPAGLVEKELESSIKRETAPGANKKTFKQGMKLAAGFSGMSRA